MGVQFTSAEGADFTLTLGDASALKNLVFQAIGQPLPFGAAYTFLASSPTVYVNNLRAYGISQSVGIASVVGSVGAHELTHPLLGADQPFSQQGQNIQMFDTAPPQNQAAALANPSNPLWNLTSDQAGTLFNECQFLKRTRSSARGGGGGSNGQGGGGGAVVVLCVWYEVRWVCRAVY